MSYVFYDIVFGVDVVVVSVVLDMRLDFEIFYFSCGF